MSSPNASPPIITFLSDYGHEDEFVGVCHAVIARFCPHARVIDLTHGVPAGDVRWGALVLADSVAFLPAGVHLAVVDPGVGAGGAAARRALALRARDEERLLVGPDNGLLTPAAARLGGVLEAVEISASPVRLQPTSRTFHGRDVFAPVAAALAAGEPLSALGEPLAADDLHTLELSAAALEDGALLAHVLRADRFGNLVLDASPDQLAQLCAEPGGTVEVRAGAAVHHARRAHAFADVREGELLLYEDAQRWGALAVRNGSAAQLLGAHAGDRLELRAR